MDNIDDLHPMMEEKVIRSNTYKSKESIDYYDQAVFLLKNGYVSNIEMTLEEVANKLEGCAKDKQENKGKVI